MAEAVFMPRLGQSVESCIITEWVKKKGDAVKQGDVLFCYETDKASFEETSKTSGILLEVFYNEGEEVPVLSNVCVIGKPGEDTSTFRNSPDKSEKSNENANPKQKQQIKPLTESYTGEKVKISPRARNLALLKGISISEIKGSGPNGRIIVRDIEAVSNTEVTTSAAPEVSINAEFKDSSLSSVRKLIAKSMLASIQNSAQLTHHTSADARKMLELRASYKNRAEKGEIPNISINDLVCFATIRALEKMPAVNAHFLGEKIRTFSKVHLGIAVDTERGLMVPVIPNASDLNLKALSVQMKQLAENCRKGNVNPELLKSENASFTISNLGAYGVELFTPVLNLPQVGILGVNTITYRPADLGNNIIGFIPVIGLSLTYDHRAIDGAPASAFLKEVRNQIENLGKDLI